MQLLHTCLHIFKSWHVFSSFGLSRNCSSAISSIMETSCTEVPSMSLPILSVPLISFFTGKWSNEPLTLTLTLTLNHMHQTNIFVQQKTWALLPENSAYQLSIFVQAVPSVLSTHYLILPLRLLINHLTPNRFCCHVDQIFAMIYKLICKQQHLSWQVVLIIGFLSIISVLAI